MTSEQIEKQMAETLCTFVSEGERCEDTSCRRMIPPGEPIHFFSDGGWEPRDGTYMCADCARKSITGEEGEG